MKPDGFIEKYKTISVAKGYTQKKGIDCFDTYSLVARISTVRVLLALLTNHKIIIHQMDIKIVFLMVTFKKRFIWINLKAQRKNSLQVDEVSIWF